jgi:hypothetical protein
MAPPRMRDASSASLRFLTWVCVVVLTDPVVDAIGRNRGGTNPALVDLQRRPSEPFAAGCRRPPAAPTLCSSARRRCLARLTRATQACGMVRAALGAPRPRARGWLPNGQDHQPDHCPEPARQDQRDNQRSSSCQSRSDQPCGATGVLRSPVNRGKSALRDHPFNHQLLPFGAELDRLCAAQSRSGRESIA